MMTTTTYGFRAEEERMNAADDRADARMRREAHVWNALQAITQPHLRESAYDALATEVDCATFHDRWLQVGPYIVGVLDNELLPTIAVHKLSPYQQDLIGIEALAQHAGEIGVEGGFIYAEPIGNALCHARFHGGGFIVDITTAE